MFTFPFTMLSTNDPYTVMHFDGSSLTDREGNIFTLNGDATLSSGINLPRLGITAIPDYAQTLDFPALSITNKNFTVEAIVRSSSWYTGSDHYGFIFLSQRGSASQLSFAYSFYNGNIYLEYSTSGSSFVSLTFGFSPVNNTDYILGLTRNGTQVTASIDNVLIGSPSSIGAASIFDSGEPLRIGGDSFNAHGIGLVKAIRLSVGISKDITNISSSELIGV